jgi:superfamily II DNA or RNA helicase
VTATPGTKGKKALGNFFETIAFEVGLIELIRAGYLSPISVKSFPLIGGGAEPISFAVKNGDYDQEQVDHALDPYLESIVARLGAEIGDRKTLVFLPLIKTVERFVALCNAAGLKAAGVSGVSEERADILSAHGTDFQILANSMLLTEGYDDPAISAMMILRPTRSEILFSQMVGRGTRIHCPWGCTERCTHGSRKRNLLLLDPLWLHEDMNLVRPANLVTGRDEDRRSMSERVAEKQEELDLLNMLADAEHDREKSLAEKLARMEKRKTKTISVEEWAVLAHAPNIADFEPTMRWHESPISPKQAEMLTRFGFDAGSVRGRGHASALLDVFFSRRKQGLATVAQVRLMTKMKHPNPETETFAGAKAWLDERFSKTKTKTT